MKKTSFFIAGKHAVTGALKNPKRKVLTIFLTEDSKKKLNRDNPQLNLLKNVKIFYKTGIDVNVYTRDIVLTKTYADASNLLDGPLISGYSQNTKNSITNKFKLYRYIC